MKCLTDDQECYLQQEAKLETRTSWLLEVGFQAVEVHKTANTPVHSVHWALSIRADEVPQLLGS